MTRTIRLTRMHALNWYGYRDTIQVEGNLLLAGLTGSGKSILMDLIQYVLVGDQRLVRFNQSATGDRSDRTLKGYCLGDTKQEENGVTQYMRSSAISYVALEFTWPNKKKMETWGIRAEFASAAEAHGRTTPFFIPASLERSHFLDAEKRPLDYTAFKAMAEGRGGRLYPEGLEAYLRDMAQPTHLNFDRNILRSLLPTAMSFTFLKSFNEFARHFILPAGKLDVSDVTSSYRTFLGYERDLTELNDQFEKLRAIRETFMRWTEFRRDSALSRYLEAQFRHEHAAEQLRADEEKLAGLREECASEEMRLKELEEVIERGRAEAGRIATLIHQTPEGRLYSFIKSENAKLARQISQLSEIGNTLEQALAARVRNAAVWIKELRRVPFDLDAAVISAVERAMRAVESGGVAKAGETLRALSEAAKQAAAEASRAAAPVHKRLADIRHQLGQLREEIAALRIGKLPFPTRLLDALNSGLLQKGADQPARPLCKLCEVVDERWRPAIEIAFTRKFAVVVDAQDYDQAEKTYHGLKASELGGDAGRESLVNPVKALKSRKSVRPGSLAEKIQTRHPVAEAIVAQLFGDLMCVERREHLREHDYAIMPDGFMTRGAFVERPRFFDGIPFVGERGLEQQLAWKEKQRDELESEERQLRPEAEAVLNINEGWRQHFEQLPPNLYENLAQARELPRLQAELEKHIQELQTIDRAKFDDLAVQQAGLEEQLRRDEEERRQLDRSEKRSKLKGMEVKVSESRDEVQKLAERFDQVRNETDISPWLKRLEELRSETLTKWPVKNVAAAKLHDQSHHLNAKAFGAWEELKAKRRELAGAHPRFDDLPIESESNDAHDKQLAKLEQSDIPDYKGKAERERRNWEALFRTQVLEKLNSALQEVRDLLYLLNNSLKKRPIGSHRYQLHHWQNPDFKIYHDLVQASSLARSDELFFASAEASLREAMQHFLRTLTEQPDSTEAARLLDYRHYYEYDMEVLEEDGRKTSVDRHSGKFSGGENQSPYFIAILASYLRAYRRYGTRKQEPSLGLVPIDEAFSKLSGERIKDCITALKAFDLQGVFSMSTGNIPYAFEHCDWLVVVSKEERRHGKRMEIRNIPVSLARESEDAQRMMGETD